MPFLLNFIVRLILTSLHS